MVVSWCERYEYFSLKIKVACSWNRKTSPLKKIWLSFSIMLVCKGGFLHWLQFPVIVNIHLANLYPTCGAIAPGNNCRHGSLLIALPSVIAVHPSCYCLTCGRLQQSDWTFPSSEGPRIIQLEGKIWRFLTKNRGTIPNFFRVLVACSLSAFCLRFYAKNFLEREGKILPHQERKFVPIIWRESKYFGNIGISYDKS